MHWNVEILAREPDPNIVRDADCRAEIARLKIPWRVRDLDSGIVMLLVPPGRFRMGSPQSERGRSSDERQHWRRIRRPFYMSETAVTESQWNAVVGSSQLRDGPKRPKRLVGEEPERLLSSLGAWWRLPTEAEWEYACRAGTTTAFSYGDTPSSQYMHWNEDGETGRLLASDVRCYAPNPLGFFDMHGGILEICDEFYWKYPRWRGTERATVQKQTATEQPFSRTYVEGAAPPVLDHPIVCRGGSSRADARACRSAARSKCTRTRLSSEHAGMRVVRTIPTAWDKFPLKQLASAAHFLFLLTLYQMIVVSPGFYGCIVLPIVLLVIIALVMRIFA